MQSNLTPESYIDIRNAFRAHVHVHTEMYSADLGVYPTWCVFLRTVFSDTVCGHGDTTHSRAVSSTSSSYPQPQTEQTKPDLKRASPLRSACISKHRLPSQQAKAPLKRARQTRHPHSQRRRRPDKGKGGDSADWIKCAMGEGPAGGSLALNVTSAVVTFASAALIFQVGWKESEARVWRFSSFADVNKADWSAR